jgi:hypothetical protein
MTSLAARIDKRTQTSVKKYIEKRAEIIEIES